jgi:hypothetical protein
MACSDDKSLWICSLGDCSFVIDHSKSFSIVGGSDAEDHLISYRQFLSHTAHIRVLANELGQRKISVNAVAPGPVAADLFLIPSGALPKPMT